ncbi:hypothetical protein [Burkholderia cepacia]|nr:hypothetical protein [Burkholderia cepacia]
MSDEAKVADRDRCSRGVTIGVPLVGLALAGRLLRIDEPVSAA